MDKLQEEIQEILVKDIKYSAQTEGYIIHGAIKNIRLLFLKKLREEKEKAIEDLRFVLEEIGMYEQEYLLIKKRLEQTQSKLETLNQKIKEIEG